LNQHRSSTECPETEIVRDAVRFPGEPVVGDEFLRLPRGGSDRIVARRDGERSRIHRSTDESSEFGRSRG